MSEKVNLHDLQKKKADGEPISMITAYDYPGGKMADQSGADMILVGDSLGMVVHGFDTTLPVTMDMMVMHCQAVRRGVEHAYLVGDLPFMSFQVSSEEALRNAGRMLAESGVDAVKLEGGEHMAETISRMVDVGMAVHAHIGLTPQSVRGFGGMKVQGKSIEVARKIIHDADAVQEAGAFAVVLEAVPAPLAEYISKRLDIFTIGIGAGPGCDGQVLVYHDLLGLYDAFEPKFVRRYANLWPEVVDAISRYNADVRSRSFPAAEHSFSLPDEVMSAVYEEFGEN